MIKVVHWGIVSVLCLQALYSVNQVFFVLQPEGMSGPMFMRATELPFELMVARRLYAIEGWMAFGILVLYLAVTEVRPRLHQGR